MSAFEYALSSIAWSLLGVVLTLSYQRVAGWWRQKKDLQHPPPISTGAYFGTVLILFVIITVLFSYSQQLADDANKKCQEQINQINVTAANTRNRLQNDFNQKVIEVVRAENKINLKFQELIAHPATTPSAMKKATQALLKVINHAVAVAVKASDAFVRAQAYVRTHPSIPVTSCNGGETPVITPDLPSPTPSTEVKHS